VKLFGFLIILMCEFMCIYNFCTGDILFGILFLILTAGNTYILYQREKINQELDKLAEKAVSEIIEGRN
jgi:hypothetical protein